MDAIIALEDGTILHGKSTSDIDRTVCGELVFNTAMTGYQEVITDPSYSRQIVVFTYPHIGNTGINQIDNESDKPYLEGIIARDIYSNPTHWQSKLSLPVYLNKFKIPAVYGIDTRSLTKKLRSMGAINACIMTGVINEKKAVEMAKSFDGLEGVDLANLVTTKTTYNLKSFNEPKFNIAVIDFGVKNSILSFLRSNNCNLKVFSANSEFDISEFDGVVLSNGPGDPKAVTYAIDYAKKLAERDIPLMGICLGCQILALALGAKTKKMKFGHHGINHPVKDLDTKKVLITSQNHGFVVELAGGKNYLRPTHVSLFDHSLQGFRHVEKPIFGFQGHPESGPGPEDGREIFKPFLESIHSYKASKSVAIIEKQKGDVTHA